MDKLLIEGLATSFSPCNLTLLIVGIAVIAAARKERLPAGLAYLFGTVAYSTIVGSGRTGELSATAAGILFGAAAILCIPRPKDTDLQRNMIISGVLAGIAAAAIWVPCVGTAYGELLADLPTAGIEGVGKQFAYNLGLLVPVVIVGAGFTLLKPKVQKKIRVPAAYAGGFTIFVLGLLAIAGRTSEITNQLFQWSL